MRRLGRDRLGRRAAIDRIGSAPDSTVKIDAGRRGCLEIMKRKIVGFDHSPDLTMDRANMRQLQKRRPKFLHEFGNGPALTSDHGLFGGVSGQDVDSPASGDDRVNCLDRARDNPRDPFDRLGGTNRPVAPGRFTWASQLALKERGQSDPLE